ncbi:MAG: hypothetical protein M3Z05_20805 [Gemmatimonadota bacterium]|nr:hypothetical protein [Gemmatimonadota bacterium]
MRNLLGSALVLIVAVATGCEKAAQPHDGAAPGAVAESPSVVATGALPLGAATLVTEAIDTTMSLAHWLAAHPGDVVLDTVPAGGKLELVCRSAAAPLAMGPRRFIRSAVFNLPDPPAGEVLPDTAGLAGRLCSLRALWLVAEEPDSLHALRFADSLSRSLQLVLGPGSPANEMLGMGSGLWQGVHSWILPGRTIVMGVAPPRAASFDEGSHGDSATKPSQVIVVAFSENSGLARHEIPTADDSTPDVEQQLELVHADSALSLTTPAVAAALRPLVARARSDAAPLPRTPSSDSALVRAAHLVRAAVPTLAPSQRAAALFALDVAVWGTMRDFAMNDSGEVRDPLRKQLDDAGLPYTDASLDGIAGYTRAALHEAFAADSLGPAGRFALLALLRSGWYGGPACGAGSAAFDSVIAHGESALQRGSADPFVQYYVGSALNDIVALAHSDDDTYVNAAEFRPREARARRRALSLLMAAHPGLRGTRPRRDSWRTITGLVLGRSTGARYFCVYD